MPGKWSEVTQMASQGAGRQTSGASKEWRANWPKKKKRKQAEKQEYIERVESRSGSEVKTNGWVRTWHASTSPPKAHHTPCKRDSQPAHMTVIFVVTQLLHSTATYQLYLPPPRIPPPLSLLPFVHFVASRAICVIICSTLIAQMRRRPGDLSTWRRPHWSTLSDLHSHCPANYSWLAT